MDGISDPNSLPEEIPTGIENLLALAAVNEEFAAALARDPEAAAGACGIELSESERAMLAASTPESLAQMAALVDGRLQKPARRRFLELATAAVVTLAAGGVVTVNRGGTVGAVSLVGAGRATPPSSPPPTGIRPDRPSRPRPDPKEQGPSRGINPERPAPKKKTSGSGCNR